MVFGVRTATNEVRIHGSPLKFFNQLGTTASATVGRLQCIPNSDAAATEETNVVFLLIDRCARRHKRAMAIPRVMIAPVIFLLTIT